jgi:hypothetical protein
VVLTVDGGMLTVTVVGRSVELGNELVVEDVTAALADRSDEVPCATRKATAVAIATPVRATPNRRPR